MKIVRLFFLLLLILILTISCSLFSTTTTPPAQTLTVRFFNVGQGDAILLDMGDTEVLIDGGARSPGVVSYLGAYVDGSIEVMVATHTDADHIGGLIAVLNAYNVGEIWVNGYTATSKTFKEFTALADAEGATIHEAVLGNVIKTGDLTLNVLSPARPLFKDANNNSIVLSLSYGKIDFLFTGDAETEAEERMLEQSLVRVPDVEILKLGHHGSRTATSPEFLDIIKPETAVYMCAPGNDYGHPHAETINALTARGITIYGTDTRGTITITTDGEGYWVGAEK